MGSSGSPMPSSHHWTPTGPIQYPDCQQVMAELLSLPADSDRTRPSPLHSSAGHSAPPGRESCTLMPCANTSAVGPWALAHAVSLA